MDEPAAVASVGPQLQPGRLDSDKRLLLGSIGCLLPADTQSGPHIGPLTRFRCAAAGCGARIGARTRRSCSHRSASSLLRPLAVDRGFGRLRKLVVKLRHREQVRLDLIIGEALGEFPIQPCMIPVGTGRLAAHRAEPIDGLAAARVPPALHLPFILIPRPLHRTPTEQRINRREIKSSLWRILNRQNIN